MPTYVAGEGNAIVYCQGAFNTTNGKTAHGLVRTTRRYKVVAVIDDRYQERDAGEVLDGRTNSIPVVGSLDEALKAAQRAGAKATHFVIGLAPDGGRLPKAARKDVLAAIRAGLHVDAGLHDFLSDSPEFVAAAAKSGSRLRDVRRTPPRSELHFFSGDIEKVDCLTVAVLGTDSAVGKRTTTLLVAQALADESVDAEVIGTGQTTWLQGLRYGIVIDSLINDFVAGEIEHAVVSAWREQGPDVILLEGQGSLMNPAYPGGFELLAAGRPDVVILQHAPARVEYDGFPGYPMHPIDRQIQAIELISSVPVVAITLNHENLDEAGLAAARKRIAEETGLPVCAPLKEGVGVVVDTLLERLSRGKRR